MREAVQTAIRPRVRHARHSIFAEGASAGLAGAAAVALWFFIYDLIIGAPFRTPALLGAALFRSAHDWRAVEVAPSIVLKYTVFHVVVFALLGWALAGLLALA